MDICSKVRVQKNVEKNPLGKIMTTRVVIIGAGQAAATLIEQLHRDGFEGSVTLLGDETLLPYQRPPLSKDYFKGAMEQDRLVLRPADYYEKAGTDVKTGLRATGIDRAQSIVVTSDGTRYGYDALVLATGARPRPLPLNGMDAENVVTIRTITDADKMKALSDESRTVVVIGGGFIGLEAAAVLKGQGKHVTLVEAAPRLMGRAVSTEISDAFAALHEGEGVDVRLNCGVENLVVDQSRVTAVGLGDGTELAADLVIVGIGALPNDDLARDASLACDGGILVDLACRTSDPAIYAIGDCTRLKNARYGQALRLESVQNAIDQGRVVAQGIMGQDAVYDALPWFWSDQFDVKLQIAGLIPEGGSHLCFEGEQVGRLLVVHFDADDRFVAAETMSRAGDHMAARRILDGKAAVSREQIVAANGDLKTVMRALRS